MNQYPLDYCGKEKLEDMNWRQFITDDDKQDDDNDKPASKELIEMLGVDPATLNYDED